MHRTRKRGFTIVELVIVIAVIAILAAVLIPTFTSLIDKANLSSDIQAVRQMNMVLAAESALEKPADFAAVCGILGDAGYDDQKGMRPVSEDHRFFWHSEQNEIFLAKIVDDEQIATVVFPEDHAVLTFTGYANYTALLGDKVFDLAYPRVGYESTDISVTGISLNKTEISLAVSATETLTATVAPNNATNKTVTWFSSNEGVATVDQNGLVTAIASGTATITATAGGQSATCTVNVSVLATGVSLNQTTLTLDSGSTATLIATIAPNNATNKTVTWSSSDEGVATVDQNGLVTAVSGGTATITATTEDGGYTANCQVTVTQTTVTTEASSYVQLVAALKNGGNIKLNSSRNITLSEHIEITEDTVLDLNGKTLAIKSADLSDSGIDVNDGVTLTIGGSGTLQITGSGADGVTGGGHGCIYVAQGGTLILENVTVKHKGGICLQNHGNLTVKGCTITGKNETINNGVVQDGVVIPGTLYIENTEFDIDAQDSSWPVIWNRQGSTVNFGANVIITGEMLNDYYGGALFNEGGYITGTPTITVTYLE